MGVWLKIDYPRFANLRPRYVTNAQVEVLAWRVRLQLDYTSPSKPKIPLDLLFGIEGATVNGVRLTFRWEVEDAIHDEHGAPVLGACDCDPTEWPDTIMLSANAGMVAGVEDLLRSILAHELGHGICDAPGWLTAHRNWMLSGATWPAAKDDQMRAITPDVEHLFRQSERHFAEFRASAFMGAFLVPRPIVIKRLEYHAPNLGVPLIQAPAPASSPFGDSVPGFRIATRSDDTGHFWLRPLLRALAPEFGVSPRFIQVRLMRYGLLNREDAPRGRRASYM